MDYKRHDLIGWNYRLPEFNSAIALAQLERLDEFIDYRIKTAEIFIDAMNECDYLLPQITPNSSKFLLGISCSYEEKVLSASLGKIFDLDIR